MKPGTKIRILQSLAQNLGNEMHVNHGAGDVLTVDEANDANLSELIRAKLAVIVSEPKPVKKSEE